MARSLDQISTDLAKLDTATGDIDQDLQTVYQEYLTVLGQAVKRQLVLAAYHLSTQAYPEEFLDLTVAQREKLQASLRHIAAQGQAQILQLGNVTDLKELATQLEEAVVAKFNALEPDPDNPDEAASDEETPAAFAEDAAAPHEEIAETESDEQSAAETSDEDWPPSEEAQTVTLDIGEVTAAMMASAAPPAAAAATPPPEAEGSEAEEAEAEEAESDTETKMAKATDKASSMLQRLGTSLSLFSILGAEPLTPVSLAKRHVLLERHLRAVLQTLSGSVNHLFKQAGILPDLPEMVIAAATEAEGGESGPSTPNLVSVLVEMSNRLDEGEDSGEEADDDDDFEIDEADREMTYLVAVNLRLADIEFADHHVALWRSRLQETLKKLKRLGSRYQKLQQEKARAEAEHAWRAVWFEE